VLFGFSSHFLGGHGEPVLEEWLHPVLAQSEAHFHARSLGFEYLLMAVSVGGAIASWTIARKRYGANRAKTWAADEQKLPGFTLLQNKYYVDEIYAATIVKWFLDLRIVLAEMDHLDRGRPRERRLRRRRVGRRG
jgi:NADH-quinone oxidoreductase subunit L